MPDPAPGMPLSEMYPGRWHGVLELAIEAQRDRVVIETELANADGDLGIIRFVPLSRHPGRVAAHWTPNGPGGPRRADAVSGA